jgi:hypothetical protein
MFKVKKLWRFNVTLGFEKEEEKLNVKFYFI